jgi:hypothetical protein
MSYLQIKGEPILPIRRQDLAELILANKGVLADRWKVNSLNMPARSSGTSSRRQDLGVRPDRWCATQRSKTRLLNIGCIDHWLIHTWAPDYMFIVHGTPLLLLLAQLRTQTRKRKNITEFVDEWLTHEVGVSQTVMTMKLYLTN